MLVGSFYTGLSGLQANATALNVIGNNLANINTVGFNRSQANFGQIMSDTVRGISGSGNPIQIGLGVSTLEVVAKFEQGSIQTTGIKSHLAIQGEGFFMVNQNGINSFSRAGNFGFDEEGFLVSASGARVQGFVGTNPDGTVDRSSGIEDIQVDLGQASPPRASELVRFVSNLSAETPVSTDPLEVQYSSSIEVFDSKGVSHQVTINYRRIDDIDVDGENSTQWEYSFEFNGEASGATAADLQIDVNGTGTNGGTLTFGSDGRLNTIDGNNLNSDPPSTVSPAANPTITISNIDGGPDDLELTWDLIDPPNEGATNPIFSSFISNFGSTNNTGTLFQDGYGSGVLQDIDFDQNGTMIGFFDNGLSLELARVAVATFNNKVGLKQIDGGYYLATAASGPASIDGEGTGGKGSILSSSLESSNVDIAEEFTSLIIHQRGYQSNSKTITTADQLLQEALNLKR